MPTTNENSLGEPIIFVGSNTLSYLHPSDRDKSLYENHKSKPMGTTTYKYF